MTGWCWPAPCSSGSWRREDVLVAKALEVTPQAARRIVLELGLREMTGRGGFGRGVLCDQLTNGRAIM